MRLLPLAALFAAALPLCSAAAQAPDLPTLERRVDEAYSVAAASAHARSSSEALNQAIASSGWKYVFSNTIGPRADQVRQSGPQSKYAQNAGYGVPLFGTRSREKDEQASAQRERDDAAAALTDVRRTALLTLREGYIQYWQSQRLDALAGAFLQRAANEERPVRSLVRAGFWTPADLLGFEETLRRVQSDQATAKFEELTQLAAMRSVIGTVDAFAAPPPAFACISDRERAVASAEKSDLQLAEIDAQITQVRTESRYVAHSAATGDLSFTVGTSIDTATGASPASAAYSLNVGSSLAMPVHGRSEERAERQALKESIQEQTDLALQRRRDLESAVDAAIGEWALAREEYDYAVKLQADKAEALRVARTRFETERMTTHPLYADVLSAEADKYAADQSVAAAAGVVAMKAAALAGVAPEACTTQAVREP